MNEIEADIKTAKLKPRIILGLVTIIIASLIYGESETYSTRFTYEFHIPGLINTFMPKPTGFSRAYHQPMAPLSVNFPSWFKAVKIEHNTADSGRVLVVSENLGKDYLQAPRYIPFEDYFVFKKSYNLDNLWYNSVAMTDSTYFEKLKEKNSNGNSSLEIIGADIAGQRVALRIRGQISITGKYNQQNNSIVSANMSNEQKNFLLDQTQQFTIEGTIGDRVTISIDEDSERDFQFENAIKIKYTGKEDEIIQSANFGNIGLSLPGTQYVTGSSSSTGLFGGKAVMKFGPVDVTAIASYEKKDSKKKSWGGGSSDGGGSSVKIYAYEYKRNTYYYIDEVYRDNMYPLDPATGNFIGHGDDIVIEYQLYVSCSETDDDRKKAVAYVDIASDGTNTRVSEHPEEDVPAAIYFKQLKKTSDTNLYGEYELNENLGYIRLNLGLADHQILAIAYKTKDGKVYGDLSSGKYLKIIKAENPKPSYKTWDLEMKNIYDLKARNIDEEGFDLKIFYSGENQPKEYDSKGLSYLSTFGLDEFKQNGSMGSDGKIDIIPNIVNLSKGELWFPFARPFDAAPEGEFGTGVYNDSLDVTGESDKPSVEEIYNLSYTDPLRKNKDYYIEVKYSNRSSTIDLGEMFIIENSEEVRVNGKKMTKGSDYDIDYFSGLITLKSEAALDANAKIDINYETEQLFGGIGEQKFMTGARAEYRINENAFIGATMMYYNRSVLDDKNVNIGDEPFHNFIWDVNGEFQYDLNWLDRAMNALPFVRIKKASQIKVNGEIAQILPNPNTIDNEESGDFNGVAKLDDFESASQETPMNISFTKWTHASKPKNTFFSSTFSERGFLFWYNPFSVSNSGKSRIDATLTQDIWPQKDITESERYTSVLNLVLDPEVNGITGLETQSDPRQIWGGVMQPVYMYDQSNSKYIELWVKGENGQLQIDIGEITEDWYNKNYDVNNPDTEYGDGEKNYEDKDNNGILNDNEDTGINGYTDAEEQARGWDPMIDNFDKDAYKTASDFRWSNGSEGNAGKEGIQTYPESEDIDRDGKLDQADSYYSYTLDLSSEEWLKSRSVYNNGRETGWKKYSIPLTAMVDSVGSPSFSSVRMLRMSVFGMEEQDTLQFASISIVGNEWLEEGLADAGSDIFMPDDDRFSITVKNTTEDADYKSPPGVTGRTQVGGIGTETITEKEQSLVLKLKEFEPGETALAQKIMLEGESLLMYKQLKMFVHGPRNITNDEARINLFLRIGRGDMSNYYEAVTEVYPEWDDRNHIEMIFEVITGLKNRVVFDNEEYFSYAKGYIKEYRPKDPLTGEYTGKIFRVVGDPTLSRIEKMQIGVINVSDEIYEGDIWVDELRVVSSNNDPGMAMRGNFDFLLGNFVKFNMNASKKDADFHQVNQQMSTGTKTSEEYNMTMTMRLHELFPHSWRITMPITLHQRKTKGTPKYFPGSDILLDDNPPDSLISTLKSQSLRTSFARSSNSNDPFVAKYLINPIKVSATLSKTKTTDLETKDKEESKFTSIFNYDVSIPEGEGISYLAWIPFLGDEAKDQKFYWKPSSFKWKMSVTQDEKEWITRSTLDTNNTYSFYMSKEMSFAYKPFTSMSFTYSRSSKSDLEDYRDNISDLFSEISYDSLMNGVNVGAVTSMNEAVNFNYSPTLTKWLRPNFKYSSKYRYSFRKEQLSANIGVSREISGNVSLTLKTILESIEKSQKKRKANRLQRSMAEPNSKFDKEVQRGADPDPSSARAKTSASKRRSQPLNISTLLGRVSPIKFSFSNNLVKGNSGVTGSDMSKIYKDVVYKYRYGFVDYYTLPTQSFDTSIVNPMTNVLKESYSISTGLQLTKTLKIRSISYKQNTSTGRDYTYKTKSNEFFDEPTHILVWGDTLELSPYDSSASRNYIPMGESGKEGFVAPDYSLEWSITPSQISWLKNRVDFIRKISFSHKLSSKETIRYQQKTDKFPYYMEVASASYTLNFSPLIKVGFTFKNKMTANFSFNKSIKYDHRGDSELDYLNTSITKNNQDNITFNMSYSYNKGISIPTPFLKNMEVLNLDNDMTFTLQGKYGFSKKVIKEFNSMEFSSPKDHRINWEIEPKLRYSFSKNIDGTLFFKYGQRINLNQQTEDGDTALDDYKDFGLTVTIKIRG